MIMALHYHGLPLTPERQLPKLNGKNVCISYATYRQSNVDWAVKNAQSIMLDNGAFSAFTRGVPFDEAGFYAWIEPLLGHPHWAVVPDVIDGTVEQQRALTSRWPFARDLGVPVWHLALPFDYLLELVDTWPRVCFGSSGEYWKIGSPEWLRRMDDAFEFLAAHRKSMPWIHGLRMLGQLGKRWPLASADSVNVAINYNRNQECPGCMAHRIDVVNGPVHWSRRLIA